MGAMWATLGGLPITEQSDSDSGSAEAVGNRRAVFTTGLTEARDHEHGQKIRFRCTYV